MKRHLLDALVFALYILPGVLLQTLDAPVLVSNIVLIVGICIYFEFAYARIWNLCCKERGHEAKS